MALYYYGATGGMVELLLEQGEDAQAIDEDGIPILNFACFESSGVAVEPLLKHGADPNAKDSRGSTPLMATDSPDVAGLLIRHGAQVDARDAEESTALIYAPYKANLKLVETFLAAGAAVDAQSNDGTTALLRACDRWEDEGGDLDPRRARSTMPWSLFF